ncbi:FG-GAP-like repeat-containing protein [Thermosulfurimonas sp. F29]|uniref:FG-GAP-like repeat-containing protein n=1 Tax=Thermosulfurimonas sp. F29 TaxID=2867247 RepID=UPI001C82AA65|nr:FG-GAP-like repeat-containing protein [Thermosulfurimonas sp. F29]MBX6422490.1 FG-GAP-like repeat-containing protein [Thermosulfurimonas sp. F29]
MKKAIPLLLILGALITGKLLAALPPEIKSDLSPLSALVIGVDGNRVILDKGRIQGVRLGDLFTIYRKGQPVVHPETKKVLGYLKKPVALAEVVQVEENFATARILSRSGEFPVPTPAIRYGDIKILLVAQNRRLAEKYLPELESVLSRSRILYEPQRTLGALSPQDLSREGVNLVLYLEEGALRLYSPRLNLLRVYTLPEVAPSPARTTLPSAAPSSQMVPSPLTASPYRKSAPSVTTPVQPVSRPEILPQAPPSAQSAPSRYPYTTLGYTRPQVPRFRRVGRLPQVVADFEIGDLNGDGIPEVVYLTPKALYVARYQGALLAQYRFRGFGKVLNFSLGPRGWIALNIYQEGEGLRSELLHFTDGALKPEIKGINLILSFVDFNGDGRNDTLLGQTFDEENFFGPRVYVLSRKGNKITYREPLTVPTGFRLIGAAFADLDGDGYLETIFINRGHKLAVYRYTQKLWVSTQKVGGSLYGIKVRVGPYRQTYMETIPAEVNFLVRDLNGDGRPEVLLVANHSAHHDLLPGFPAYTSGEVMVLSYSTTGFELRPFSGGFEGPLQGLGIVDSELLVVLTKGNPFTQEGESYLLALPLPTQSYRRSLGYGR